jgi:hypothetical protein
MLKSLYYRARYWTARFFGANPQVVAGPYHLAAGQVFVAGIVSGQVGSAGAVSGQVFIAGQTAGQAV